jgi:uncharacterized heparinase superfamily protein
MCGTTVDGAISWAEGIAPRVHDHVSIPRNVRIGAYHSQYAKHLQSVTMKDRHEA